MDAVGGHSGPVLPLRHVGIETQRRGDRGRGVEIGDHPGAPAGADGVAGLLGQREHPHQRRRQRNRIAGGEAQARSCGPPGTAGGARTTSGPPPRSETTTGRPIACASRIVRGRPSGWIAAETTTVAAA